MALRFIPPPIKQEREEDNVTPILQALQLLSQGIQRGQLLDLQKQQVAQREEDLDLRRKNQFGTPVDEVVIPGVTDQEAKLNLAQTSPSVTPQATTLSQLQSEPTPQAQSVLSQPQDPIMRKPLVRQFFEKRKRGELTGQEIAQNPLVARQVGVGQMDIDTSIKSFAAKKGRFKEFKYQDKDGRIRVGSFDSTTGRVISSPDDPIDSSNVAPLDINQSEALKLGDDELASKAFPRGMTIEQIGVFQKNKQLRIKQEEKEEKRGLEFIGLSQKADRGLDLIDEILPNVDSLTTGFLGVPLSKIPGTQGSNIRANIKTIQANLAFSELQAMRKASPTGGAVGQLSDSEREALADTVAALGNEQSPEQLRRNLLRVKKHYLNFKAIGKPRSRRTPDDIKRLLRIEAITRSEAERALEKMGFGG